MRVIKKIVSTTLISLLLFMGTLFHVPFVYAAEFTSGARAALVATTDLEALHLVKLTATTSVATYSKTGNSDGRAAIIEVAVGTTTLTVNTESSNWNGNVVEDGAGTESFFDWDRVDDNEFIGAWASGGQGQDGKTGLGTHNASFAITYTTPVTEFVAGNNDAEWISLSTVDEAERKFIIMYNNETTGDDAEAVACTTTEGVNPTCGTPVSVSSSTPYYPKYTDCDKVHDDGMICAFESEDDGDGYVVVINTNASDTNVYAGDVVKFTTDNPIEINIAVDDNTEDQFVIIYQNTSQSSVAYQVAGTVTSTSTINIGTPEALTALITKEPDPVFWGDDKYTCSTIQEDVGSDLGKHGKCTVVFDGASSDPAFVSGSGVNYYSATDITIQDVVLQDSDTLLTTFEEGSTGYAIATDIAADPVTEGPDPASFELEVHGRLENEHRLEVE